MINFIIEDRNGAQQPIEIPEGINLSLMEVLKASEYDVQATCGGMALCATCLIEVLKGGGQLPDAKDAELDMLDTLPQLKDNNRLSCQIPVNESLEGCVFRLP